MAISPTSILRAYMFSSRPPRIALFLIRIALSRRGLSMRQFSAKTLRTPPEIWLPMVTPPWPSLMWQPWMTMFWEGTRNRRPSAFLPELMAMQSSPVSKSQSLMSTSAQDSGSQPSVLGAESRLGLAPVIVIPRTVTLEQSTGCTCHMGEFLSVTPSMSTFLQR